MLQKSHVVHVNHLSAAIMQSYHQCKSVTIIPHSIEAGIYNIAKRNPARSDRLKALYVGRIIPPKALGSISGVQNSWPANRLNFIVSEMATMFLLKR